MRSTDHHRTRRCWAPRPGPGHTAPVIFALWALACSSAGAQRGVLATPLSRDLSSAGYEQIRTQGGVTVYKHRTSETLRLAAEARVGHPPELVLRALLDYDAHLRAMDRLTATRVIERGEERLVVYQRLNLPVIDDRDFTLEVRWGERGGGRWVRYHAANDRGPRPTSAAVRVSHHTGSWQVAPRDGGRASFVRYETSIDLGGLVPMWMVKAGAGDEVPKVIAAVRSIAARKAAATAQRGPSRAGPPRR